MNWKRGLELEKDKLFNLERNDRRGSWGIIEKRGIENSELKLRLELENEKLFTWS